METTLTLVEQSYTSDLNYDGKISEKEVDEKFKELLKNCYRCETDEDLELIRRAYNFAKIAHRGQTRYNGDVFINHPVEVAKIVAQNIWLPAQSIVAAMLHDVPTNTEYTVEDIRLSFGDEIARLVELLVRIKGTSKLFSLDKIDMYKRVIAGIAEDVRVLYIKIADRLHNMRTLYSLEPVRKRIVAEETLRIYAPLAEMLGLFAIKTELEDLAFAYLYPAEYGDIVNKLKASERDSIMYLNKFSLPIIAELKKRKINFDIVSRQKSVYSIWRKMKRKNIRFEDVYDVFAIRIVVEPEDDSQEEKLCYEVFDIVKSLYPEVKEDRIRDWIKNPKENGYQALHLTVKGHDGKRWIEVQIRSKNMDKIAEHGLAAHVIYKDENNKNFIINGQILDLKKKLESITENIHETLKEFKPFDDNEIIVYTPKKDVFVFPRGATVLDFAFAIHTKLGMHCLGAHISEKGAVPPDYVLQTGDVVHIITSQKQLPTSEWLDMVVTEKAKRELKDILQIKRIDERDKGRDIIADILAKYELQPTPETIKYLVDEFGTKNKFELYLKVATGEITREEIEEKVKPGALTRLRRFFKLASADGTMELEEGMYKIAQCCMPVPGDKIVAVRTNKGKYIIHKQNCRVAAPLINKKKNNFFFLEWKPYRADSHFVKLKLEAKNEMGILYKLTEILYNDLKVNIKTLFFTTVNMEADVSGWIELYIQNIEHLDILIKKIKSLKAITSVDIVSD